MSHGLKFLLPLNVHKILLECLPIGPNIKGNGVRYQRKEIFKNCLNILRKNAVLTYFNKEQIQERIKALPNCSKYLTRDQIRCRIQELAITVSKRHKGALRG